MARIILITGDFPIYDSRGVDTGRKEFVVSHGVNEDTGQNVILPNEKPSSFGGAYYDGEIGEWVLPDKS
jgi:hypothetical protein